MNKIIFVVLAVLFGGFATSCSSVSLAPGAQNVVITNMTVSGTCKFAGNVNSYYGNDFSGSVTSPEYVQTMLVTILKNQVADLHANVVVIMNRLIINPTFPTKRLRGHKINGKAYLCDSNALSKITQVSIENIPEIQGK
jgi:hypothetical protein